MELIASILDMDWHRSDTTQRNAIEFEKLNEENGINKKIEPRYRLYFNHI